MSQEERNEKLVTKQDLETSISKLENRLTNKLLGGLVAQAALIIALIQWIFG